MSSSTPIFFASFALLFLSLYTPLQFVEAVDVFTITGSITEPFDNFPATKTMFSEMGLLSTFTPFVPPVATSAQLAQYNCTVGKVNANSKLFGLACTIPTTQTMYIACGENSIERVIEVDPNGLMLSNTIPPILGAFAMVSDRLRIWTIDKLSDQLLRLTSWAARNTSDVESCIFSMNRRLDFTDELGQLPMAVLGDEAFYLIGRVEHRNDLDLISLPRVFEAGTECQGTQVPLSFRNFSSVPYPLQGISWNARNQSIILPVALDWTVTQFAQIDPATATAIAIPAFNMTLPDTLYAGGYDIPSNSYTAIISRNWPVWSYKTYSFRNHTWSSQMDFDMPDAQFYIQAACVY